MYLGRTNSLIQVAKDSARGFRSTNNFIITIYLGQENFNSTYPHETAKSLKNDTLVIKVRKMLRKMSGHIEYDTWSAVENEKYLKLMPNDINTILDVGCGRGEFLYHLKNSGFEAEGCDFDDVCVEKSSHFAPTKKADILELSKDYPINSFDLVISLHLLEHVLCPYSALIELKKVSRKYIFIAVPNARYTAWDERPTHLYSWNGDTLSNLVLRAGLKILFLKQDRTNIFPNIVRATPIVNRLLLKAFVGPNELLALCCK